MKKRTWAVRGHHALRKLRWEIGYLIDNLLSEAFHERVARPEEAAAKLSAARKLFDLIRPRK